MVTVNDTTFPDAAAFELALQRAIASHYDGQVADALRAYQALISARPRNAVVNLHLGELLAQIDRRDEALPFLRMALEVAPTHPRHWLSYIDCLAKSGRQDAAQAMLAQAQQRGIKDEAFQWLAREIGAIDSPISEPAVADLVALDEFFRQRKIVEMETHARKLTVGFPQHGASWKALGTALALQGRAQDAVAAFQHAIPLLPADSEALIRYGKVMYELGQLENAETHLRRALQIDPASINASSNLARVLYAEGKIVEAEQCFRHSIQLRPNLASAHFDLATLQNEQFRFAESEAGFRRALELKPGYVPALINLGIALTETGRYAEAEGLLRDALAINSQDPHALGALSNVLERQGRHEEADATLQTAIVAHPTDLKLRSRRLFNLNCSANATADYCLHQAREFGAVLHARVNRRYTSWIGTAINSNAPKPLRVGLLSGDFCNHPVGFFLESFVGAVDSARVELYAFPTSHHHDELSARIRPAFASWQPIAGLSDEAAARAIHAAGVHVLIDLSGHTAGNRLAVFAQKPSPVQASWLGYFATTGVEEIDYLIADPVGVRASEFGQFTETIVHLPETRLCFTPPRTAPAVSLPPRARNGFVTFGCFQNLAKVGDQVLARWATILAATTDARLRMQCRDLSYASAQEMMIRRMGAAGIDVRRVSFHGRIGRDAYLSTYGEVDILLDTFPYPGGTTTCEALWMGVPTVTLAGERLLSRQGASILTAAGLPDWIAGNEADYAAQAVSRAGDQEALTRLRLGLRARVAASPLFDAPRFARNFEDAAWKMWRDRAAQ